jgi:hypothetical protein
MNELCLLVVLLHGAQWPIKEAKLQQSQPQSKDVASCLHVEVNEVSRLKNDAG